MQLGQKLLYPGIIIVGFLAYFVVCGYMHDQENTNKYIPISAEEGDAEAHH